MIESVRGAADWLPGQVARRAAAQAALEQPLSQAGYLPIELPILEHRELYLRKQGEELVGKLYDFAFHGRHLALRPELTASVLRAYIEHLRGEPQPVRLRYTGPVFRYERPRRATYRQFTQLGVELLGASGPAADAEVIALAVEGLREAGVHDFRLTIGHIGLIRELLGQLELSDRTRSALIWSLERLQSRGRDAVLAHLTPQHEELPVDLSALAHLPDADIEALLLQVLPALGVRLEGGGRRPEEIVARLVRRLRRADPPAQIERALDLLQQLGQIQGPPAEALERARAMLADAGMRQQPLLDELAEMVALLGHAGVAADQITIDFGISRGRHYYTGAIFEIDDASGAQLCGGGRYDDLVAALGGPPTPAVGFAYGLERVIAAQGERPEAADQAQVMVMAGVGADVGAALALARRLREHGWVALVDVRGRSQAQNIRDALKRGVRYLALADAEGTRWRELQSGAEQRIEALPDAAEVLS